jgi:hypothetical protein
MLSGVKCEFTNAYRERNQFMKSGIEVSGMTVSHGARLPVRPAPSLRLPVTAANRALLRKLRAAESCAWEAGRVLTCDAAHNNFATPKTGFSRDL